MTVDSREFYQAVTKLEHAICDLEKLNKDLKVIVDSQVAQREAMAEQRVKTETIWWHVCALWGTAGGLITALIAMALAHMSGGGKHG